MDKLRITLFAFFASFALTFSALAQYPGQGGSGQILIGQGAPLPLWMTMIGDCSITSAGDITCLSTNGVAFYKGLPTPVNPTDAATKQYVDSTAVGLVIHAQTRLATTAALPTNTYANGSSGVGATLTATANAALSIDSVPTSSADRVLIKNETSAADNGIYVVTSTGDSGHKYILTRATDANTPGVGNPNEIGFGTYALVTAGTVNANTGWSVNSTVTTIGSSAINWVQFSGATGVSSLNSLIGALSLGAGTGMTVTPSGSTINLALTSATITLGTTPLTLGNTYNLINGAFSFTGTLNSFGPTILGSALTYGGVTLANSVTGTGSMVLSASPVFSGTIGGTLSWSGAQSFGNNMFLTDLSVTEAQAYVCFGTSNGQLYRNSSCGASDARMKTNWQSAPGLWSILQLRPGSFEWRDAQQAKDDGRRLGMTAQDVEKVIPEVVRTGGPTTLTLADGRQEVIENTKTIKYNDLIMPLIAAVQTLVKICAALFLLIVFVAYRQIRLGRQLRQLGQ